MSLDLVQKALGDMTEATKAALAANASEIAELKGRLTAAEQEIVDRKSGSNPARAVNTVQKRISDAFAAKAAEFKELRKNPKMAVSIDTDVSVKEFMGIVPGNSPDSSYPVVPEFRPGIIDLPKPITIIDSLPHQPISSNIYEYARYVPTLSTNAAGPVAEGTAKGQTQYHFERISTSPIVIAHIAKFSQQLVDDTQVLAQFAPYKMRQQLLVKMDSQVLNGSGSGDNLNGLITQAGVAGVGGYTLASDKVSYAVATMRDAGLSPSLIAANPLDILAARNVKDTIGQYLQYNEFFGGLPIAESPNVPSGTVLIIAAGGAEVLDRTGVSFLVAYDADDFSKNLVTARCEARIGLAVYEADAVKKVSI